MKHIIMAGALLLSCSLSNAAGVYTVGAGKISCEDFIRGKSNQAESIQTAQWVAGFITSFNFYSTGKQATPETAEAMQKSLELYCTKNSKHMIIEAAAALVKQYRSEQ